MPERQFTLGEHDTARRAPGPTATARALDAVVRGDADPAHAAALVETDANGLATLAGYLRRDLAIDALERVESVAKEVLLAGFQPPVSGATARRFALFAQQVGLLVKRKSYALKCATPLGQSIFLQRPRMGFSFQRHITHKTEVFHVLEALDGALVFLCSFDAWTEVFDADRFEAWLRGRRDDRYDQYSYRPAPGDVFKVSELGIVHTVFGCVLEEFATTSTDMVDRLYDQNAGAPIPAFLNRDYAQAKLRTLTYPQASRLVAGLDDDRSRIPIAETPIAGGTVRRFEDGVIAAGHYTFASGARSDVLMDADRAASLFVVAGSGSLQLGELDELMGADAPSLPIGAGDVLLVAPSSCYRFVNSDTVPLCVTEQRLALEVAFGDQ